MNMKAVRSSFYQMLLQIKKDLVLLVMPFVPFLAGALFRFGLPFAESRLTTHFGVSQIIAPYYLLIDALLIVLTPAMTGYVAALVILEESDDGIISYLSITPLGKKGYLFSRLGIMTALTIPLNLLVSILFHIKGFSLPDTLLLSIAAAAQGCVIALAIVALSANKVEGMAIGKMASLLSIGLVIPYFISSPVQYLFAVTPSFWMAKFILEGHLIHLGISFLADTVWVLLLTDRFIKKIQ